MLGEPPGCIFKTGQRVGQRGLQRGNRPCSRQRLGEGADVREQALPVCPTVHRQLAADEVERLNAVGALVDRRDAGIAQMLGRAGLLDEAHAAEHLNGKAGDFHAGIGGVGLGERGQQVRQPSGRLAVFLVGAVNTPVDRCGVPVGERSHAFGAGLHGQEHPAHVRMLDDAHRRAGGCSKAG